MRGNQGEQRYQSREPEEASYWTPGRKGFFLGACLTALILLFLLCAGWIRPSWM